RHRSRALVLGRCARYIGPDPGRLGEAVMAEPDAALTIAICTRNRRDLVLRALASLAAQRARAAWDVLVVENAGSDDTREAVAALARDFPVPLAVPTEPARGLPHARNRPP